MDRARDQLFSRSRVAADQHRRIRGRDRLCMPQRAAQDRARADDLLEVPLAMSFVAQVDALLGEPFFQPVDLAIGEGVCHSDRDLMRDLRKEADVVVRIDDVPATTQTEGADDSVAGRERKDAARHFAEPTHPWFPGTKHLRGNGVLAVEEIAPVGVRQRDDRGVRPHEPPRVLHHRRQHILQLQRGHQ